MNQSQLHTRLAIEPVSRQATLPTALSRASSEPSRPAPPLPNLPRYEILGELGRGGMGVVYKAIDCDLKRPVAIKMILHGTLDALDAQTRFRSETEAIGRLNHPNLVRIYETGHVDGHPYAVMEFIEGGTLSAHIASRTFTPQEAARIVADLADGIDSAHQCGVLHRDLKPANVLLNGTQPKIVDFGLAKLAGSNDCTQTGDVVGTPNYMAPERVVGPKSAIGVGVDIYSLGAILFELLTRHTPFEGETPVEVLRNALDREAPSVRTLRRDVSRDLDTICRKCLQRNPAKRYLAARELAEDLRRYLRGEPIKARPIRPVERLWRWGRRNPTIAVSLALLFVVLTGVAVTSTVAAQWYRDAAKEQKADKEKAERSTTEARWQLYLASMAGVSSHLQLNNLDTAQRALANAPPEFRGWEWDYFATQMDLSYQMKEYTSATTNTLVLDEDGATLFVLDQQRIRTIDAVTGIMKDSSNTSWPPIAAFGKMPRDPRLFLCFASGEIGLTNADRTGYTILPQPAPPSKGESHWNPRWNEQGSHVVLARRNDPSVLLVNTLTCQTMHLRHTHPVRQAFLLPDGDTVIVATTHELCWWSARSGQQFASLSLSGASVVCAALRADGKQLMTSGNFPDTTVRIWDLEQRRVVGELHGHRNAITQMVLSRDGTRLVTASLDQTARIWDMTKKQPLFHLVGHTQSLFGVALTPDDRSALTTSADGTLRLWDMATGQTEVVLRGHRDMVEQVLFNPTGTRVISSCAGHQVRWWDLDAIRRRTVLGKHESFVYQVAIDPDGATVYSAGWDASIRTWNNPAGQPGTVLKHPSSDVVAVTALAFHPTEGRLLATLRTSNAAACGAYEWDLTTGKQQRHYPHSTGNWRIDTCAAYSPDGHSLVIGGERGRCSLWTVGTQQPAQHYVLNPRQELAPTMGCVAWRADGTFFAGAEDGTIAQWRPGTTRPLKEWAGHRSMVHHLQLTTDGRWLISASADHDVHLWDAETLERIATLPHGSTVFQTALHPTQQRLASACADGSIRLWDLDRFEEVADLRGHASYVKSVVFTRDGHQLVSGSGDRTVRVWDKRPWGK